MTHADYDDLVGDVGHAMKVFPRGSLPKAIFRLDLVLFYSGDSNEHLDTF